MLAPTRNPVSAFPRSAVPGRLDTLSQRRTIMLSALLLTLSVAVSADAQADALEVVIQRNVAVPMRDGVVLRADVHRPDRGGPYPVL